MSPVIWSIEFDFTDPDGDTQTHTRYVRADAPRTDVECSRDTIPAALRDWTENVIAATYPPDTPVRAIRYAVAELTTVTNAGCRRDQYGSVTPDTGGALFAMHDTADPFYWSSPDY